MATTSADVPGLYDLVVAVSGGNTTGFLLNDSLESSIPFRTHRAIYTYTPTFIERSNVSGDFGDNQQDFFLTATQRDWSLGEQQRFYRQSDGDSVRRYYAGLSTHIAEPGEVRIDRGWASSTLSANAVCTCKQALAGWGAVFGSATKLHTIDDNLTVTDQGLHVLGATPSRWGITTDLQNVYLSTTSAGTVGVRKWTGTALSTFSATGADALCYLNNTLYGLRSAAGTLVRYDTAGTATVLFTWKDAAGNAIPLDTSSQLFAFGGKLGIVRVPSTTGAGGSAANVPHGLGAAELWLYDGTAPSLFSVFPPGFEFFDVAVTKGTIYLSGTIAHDQAGGATPLDTRRPAILYYSAGNLGYLWKAPANLALSQAIGPPVLVAFNDGLMFSNGIGGAPSFLFYNADSGAISTHPSFGDVSSTVYLGGATGSTAFFAKSGSTRVVSYQSGSSTASSGYVQTSMFDFDSSLTKVFRGITVEFDVAADGDGGSVDVAYETDSFVVGAGVITLATGVTSGTEKLFGSTVTGKRISVKVTLNKGTSTNGPTLKRISVRAAPLLTRYRQQEYILNCAGDPSTEDAMALRDDANSTHPLSGRQQVNELRLAAASQTPLTLTDRFGSYTGIIDMLEAYEQHPSNADPSRSGSFLVKLGTREV